MQRLYLREKALWHVLKRKVYLFPVEVAALLALSPGSVLSFSSQAEPSQG
jgi:hypothetical protein